MAKGKFTVKGTHVMMTRSWIDEHLGDGSFAALSTELGVEWPNKFLPSGWYDVFGLNRVVQTAAKRIGVGVVESVTTIARLNAEKDLTTIYRAFMRVAGPKSLLNATPMLWRNYVAFAEAKKVSNQPGELIAECREIPADVMDWARGCWHGFLPAAVELAGGKDAVTTIVDEGAESTPGFRYLRAVVKYTP